MRIAGPLVLAAAAALACSGPAAAQSTNASPILAAAISQATTTAQPATQAPVTNDKLRARLAPRPGLRAGDKFRLDLKALFQLDARGFDPVPADRKDEWEIPRRRVGLEGELFNALIEFQVEAQIDDDDHEPWRDVYVNVRPKNWLQFQGGKFKVPFGRERLRGHSSLDFVERSNATNQLTPGRDIGGMVHGRTAGRAIEYAFGIFDKDPDSVVNTDEEFVDDEEDIASPKATGAGRVVIRPFRLGNREGFGGVEVGFGMTRSKLPEGLNSLRGRSFFDETFFDRVYVQGYRWRWGVDVYAEGGPATLTAEYLEGADDRLGQGLADDDLPDLVSRGWYLAGTYVLTGQPKADVDRVRPAFLGGGIGAVEAAVRVDQLRLASRETMGEPPFRNPRAVNLYPNEDLTWTLGLNWYLNRYVKLQGNAMRERFTDVERTLLPGETVFWSFVARLQLAL